jgi:hypothetical protein
MRKIIALALGGTFALGAAGCGDFLKGPGITENPNSPTAATLAQLFIAMQANQEMLMESQLARNTSIYTQQLIGSNNQQLAYATQYLMTEQDINNQWNGFFVGGGLIDLHKIEAQAHAAGDAQWEGITKVWEAFSIGTAASIWGDVPFREAAADNATPHLDPQQQVYGDVQKLLDDAITLLKGTGPGPGSYDLIYSGNTARWTAAAYTLKARFYLHLVERQGATAYQSALTAAQNGIGEAPTSAANAMDGQGPGDFKAFHGSTINDGNLWGQFLTARPDIVAGQTLVALLVSRNDPRLARYFDPAVAGPPAVYRGADRNNVPVGGSPSSTVNKNIHMAYTYRQPYVTWAENQLILAEAKFMTGDAAGALVNLNNERTSVGLAALPGPITLQDVMLEKYIAQYQNIDVWADYKRTCFPAVTPGGTAAEVPGRMPYGANERVSNPNIPLPSAAPTRNWDDPNACPKP